MRRLGWAAFGLVGGYAGGAALGVLLLGAFSANTHDKAVEVATTAALVTGPLGAVAGAGLGLWAARVRARR